MALSSDSQLDWLETTVESISSSEARPVRHSASQDSGVGLLTSAATSRLSLRDWLRRFALGGSCGRTSPEFCQTAPTPSGVFSGHFQSSGMASRGECWTLSSTEWPSDASVSLLSGILEPLPLPEQYFLSPRACAGILRRAKKRGKTLPARLAAALEAVAATWTDTAPTSLPHSTRHR